MITRISTVYLRIKINTSGRIPEIVMNCSLHISPSFFSSLSGAEKQMNWGYLWENTNKLKNWNSDNHWIMQIFWNIHLLYITELHSFVGLYSHATCRHHTTLLRLNIMSPWTIRITWHCLYMFLYQFNFMLLLLFSWIKAPSRKCMCGGGGCSPCVRVHCYQMFVFATLWKCYANVVCLSFTLLLEIFCSLSLPALLLSPSNTLCGQAVWAPLHSSPQ